MLFKRRRNNEPSALGAELQSLQKLTAEIWRRLSDSDTPTKDPAPKRKPQSVSKKPNSAVDFEYALASFAQSMDQVVEGLQQLVEGHSEALAKIKELEDNLKKANDAPSIDQVRHLLMNQEQLLQAMAAGQTQLSSVANEEYERSSTDLHECRQIVSDNGLTDPLTLAANRTAFDRRLKETYARLREEGPFALAMLDLDSFGLVNRSLGRQAGNQALKAFARLLREAIGRVGLVARLDEDDDDFAILAQCSEGELRKVMKSFQGMLAGKAIPVRDHEHHSVTLAVSVGVAGLSTDVPFEQSYRAAESEMLAKKNRVSDREDAA